MQLLEMGVSFEAALTALPKHPPFIISLLIIKSAFIYDHTIYDQALLRAPHSRWRR
jgi:hypothetical protein